MTLAVDALLPPPKQKFDPRHVYCLKIEQVGNTCKPKVITSHCEVIFCTN